MRISAVYPFTEEELADMVSFEMRVMYFIGKLEGKYKNLKDAFVKKMLHPTGDDLDRKSVV